MLNLPKKGGKKLSLSREGGDSIGPIYYAAYLRLARSLASFIAGHIAFPVPALGIHKPQSFAMQRRLLICALLSSPPFFSRLTLTQCRDENLPGPRAGPSGGSAVVMVTMPITVTERGGGRLEAGREGATDTDGCFRSTDCSPPSCPVFVSLSL